VKRKLGNEKRRLEGSPDDVPEKGDVMSSCYVNQQSISWSSFMTKQGIFLGVGCKKYSTQVSSPGGVGGDRRAFFNPTYIMLNSPPATVKPAANRSGAGR
jgi:hypothetical protein